LRPDRACRTAIPTAAATPATPAPDPTTVHTKVASTAQAYKQVTGIPLAPGREPDGSSDLKL